MAPVDNQPRITYSIHLKAVLPPYVSSVLMAHYGVSISALPSLQENSLGMDGAIYIAAALSENRGLRHIK